jgi:hypothetical protein
MTTRATAANRLQNCSRVGSSHATSTCETIGETTTIVTGPSPTIE